MAKKTKPTIEELVEPVEGIEDLEPEKMDDADEMLAEDATSAEAVRVEKPAPKKRKAAAAKQPTSEELLSTTQKSLEQMTKQWETIQGISTSITQNLERVHGLLKEIPLQEMLEKNIQRPVMINRMVVLFCGFSMLLSILGLSLAHSARQEVYAKEWSLLQQPRNPGYALLEQQQNALKELSKAEVARTETVKKPAPVAKVKKQK